jgi:hypothetical protein
MDSAEQRGNDLNIIIICFGLVLRHTKPLKEAILGNHCYIGWIVELLVLCW